MTTHQHRHGESSARPERDNALGAGQGAEGARQKSGQEDYSATIITPLELALERNPVGAAMLEVLGRIANALEGQQSATWSVAKNLDDLWRLLGERT